MGADSNSTYLHIWADNFLRATNYISVIYTGWPIKKTPEGLGHSRPIKKPPEQNWPIKKPPGQNRQIKKPLFHFEAFTM